jgi:CheY-like chemotaxis protein
LIVDLPSVRNTAIALHRNLQRMPELAALRVVYLHSEEPVPSELAAGRRALLLSRTIGGTELRMAITGMLETLSPMAMEESAQFILGTTASSSSGFLDTPHLHGRALLVEDNPVNQLVAQRLVGLLGLSCETADNGQMALEKMIHHRYDVVLMDCQMPVKDGYTATSEWRQHEAAHHLERVPIIAMTANAMAGDRQKCLEAGMDDYLAKPVDRHLLEVTLVRWLPTATEDESTPFASPEPAVAASAPAPVPILSTAPAPPPATIASTKPSVPAVAPAIAPTRPVAPALPVLDRDVVSELRSVMGQDYLVLIKLFLEDAPKHIEGLKAAATTDDATAMVAPAHTLKSSSANVGAMALSALAKRIELAARTGKLAQPRMAVQALEAEFEKARGQLRGLLVG